MCKQHKQNKNKIIRKALRKISLVRRRSYFLELLSFLLNAAHLPQPKRLSFSTELKQLLKQRICWELGYIIAAGSGRLLRRMRDLHINRDAAWSVPGSLAALSSRSAEGCVLQGCSCLEILLTCSGQINQERFFFCVFFFFSSAAMKRTNTKPPAWSCLRCWVLLDREKIVKIVSRGGNLVPKWIKWQICPKRKLGNCWDW